MRYGSLVLMGFIVFWTNPLIAEEAHHQGGLATVRSGQILGQPWQDADATIRWRAFTSYLESSSSFDADGHSRALPNNGNFSSWNLTLFAERSLSKRWSASGFLPVQYSRLKDDVGHRSWTSIGDIYGWMRYRFDEVKGLVPAVTTGVKIPGNYETNSGIGDGQVDLESQGFLAKMYSHGQYVAINTGLRYRLGSPSNEIPFGIQSGLALMDRLLLVPSLSGAKGVGGGIQKDFLGVGLAGFWTLKGPWSVFASYQRIVMGKNTVAADIGSLGVTFR